MCCSAQLNNKHWSKFWYVNKQTYLAGYVSCTFICGGGGFCFNILALSHDAILFTNVMSSKLSNVSCLLPLAFFHVFPAHNVAPQCIAASPCLSIDPHTCCKRHHFSRACACTSSMLCSHFFHIEHCHSSHHPNFSTSKHLISCPCVFHWRHMNFSVLAVTDEISAGGLGHWSVLNRTIVNFTKRSVLSA